ncbi:erythrocyte membrane protein 1, PfEMP1, putative [Plasmodium reichenowi]|uniref:Erythrocyte membrane protein 1, PfEMP1, putative n=1 Tax=Plasmodium reichenowi TaxID=5854 RepID=A0A2P9D5Q0_PLARE|nr:erythrocyte membrane protein 1, PfEMP1, putative [Plasmodium reichenowi]
MAKGDPQGGSDGDDIDDKDAKHLFDSIGKKVHDQVKGAAKEYTSELHGDLSKARFEDAPREQQTPANACNLLYDYHTTVTSGGDREHPCRNGTEKRFSDTEGAECHSKKIRGSNGKSEGACAPYRRLHICDYNLENINDFDNINNDTLLADVCMAAQFEGESLTHYREEYQKIYPRSHYEICNELARSFADIGDIIRGRDLYRGNKKKDKLEDNLKEIFKRIQQKSKRLNSLSLDKVREYWWEENREKVWTALTCKAPKSAKYFRFTCGGGMSTSFEQCRCIGFNVPTYFDYVPQYLRWFEEWAEDFCRKRKKQLENAKKQCRTPNDENKYCDLNGFDCERTIYKIGDFVEDADCKKCSLSCKPFVEWLGKQKEQFEKQKKKCESEINKYENGATDSSGRGRQRRSTTENYKGYDEEFYKILQSKDVGGLDKFLDLLSKETDCQNFDDKEGKIDFKNVNIGSSAGDGSNSDSNNSNKTFAPTEYCETCPLCGVKCSSGNCTKNEDDSCEENPYQKPTNPNDSTTIPRLTPEKGKTSILGKYKNFCDKTSDQVEKWECHYEETDNSNICVLQNGKQNTKEQNVTSYYSIFYGSIIDMLKESIEWRTQLGKCLKKDKKTCENKKCNDNCNCYKRWVGTKREEWTKIKEHFRKQKDMLKDIEPMSPGEFLEYYVKKEFLIDMQDANGDPNVIEKFKKLLPKEDAEVQDPVNTKKTIDEFLGEEQQIAEKCTKTQEECELEESRKRGRAEDFKNDTPQPADHDSEEDDEEEEEEDACDIVAKIISPNHGNKQVGECHPKTNGTYPPWDCTKENVKKEHNGACIPPRRQKLCLYYLTQLSKEEKEEELRKEFIKNVAAETFLSWNYYKKKNVEDAKQLDNGTIPPQFLRSMYYIFADYRDICLGTDIFAKTKNSDTTTAKEKTTAVFKNIRGQNSGTNPRETWWQKNAESIWKGMVCGLSHAGGDKDTLIQKYSYTNVTLSSDKNAPTISPEDFAKTPQFLRWFTEWGDQFCTEQKKELKTLQEACPAETCTKGKESKKKDCTKACETYKNWLKNWKTQYTTQSEKYFKDKADDKFKGTSAEDEVRASQYAYEYLNKALTKLWGNGDCKCMEGESSETSTKSRANDDAHDAHMPKSLDNEPEEVNGKCTCPEAPAAKKPEVPPAKVPEVPKENVCETVKDALNNRKNLEDACRQKYQGGKERYTQWKCVNPTKANEGATGSEPGKATKPSDTTGSICVPPRRRKLYIQKLVDWASGNGQVSKDGASQAGKEAAGGPDAVVDGKTTSESDGKTATQPDRLLLKAFVESAAVETFFLWDRYKKEWHHKNKPQGGLGLVGDGSNEARGGWTTERSEGPSSKNLIFSEDTSQHGRQRSPVLRPFPPNGIGSPVFTPLNSIFSSGGNDNDMSPQTGGLLDKHLGNLPSGNSDDPSNPQNQLLSGTIPLDFLRQMFYTISDYRDICVGVNEDVNNALEKSVYKDPSPDNKTSGTNIKEISDKIKQTLEKPNGDTAPSHSHTDGSSSGRPHSPPVKTGSNSDKTPSSWWENNAKYIWKGMICALTYTDNESEEKGVDKKPQKANGVDYNKLIENNGYTTVKLDNTVDGPKTSDDTPTLSNFVERPPFFRYLEEWGNEFCGTRKRLLKEVKDNCMEEDRNGKKQKCSTYGEQCDRTDILNTGVSSDLNCPGCAKYCRLYKRWIRRKKDEFEKQSGAYSDQKTKYEEGSKAAGRNNNGNEFSRTLGTCTDAASFLEKLKMRPCKNDNENENTEDGYIDFTNTEQTFKDADNCKPCSEFKIKCKNGVCSGGDGTQLTCNVSNKGKISAGDIENKTETTGNVDMVVSDDSTKKFEGDLKNACENAGIFEGIRKDVWTCGKVCGYDVCKSEHDNGAINGKNQIIIIRALIERWVYNFLEDYNKIKHKISHFINNKNTSTCTSDCGKKCECVGKWISTKKEEWKNIKEHYLDKSKSDDDMTSLVRNFFEKLQSQIPATIDKAIKPCPNLVQFQDSKDCAVDASSKSGEDDTPKDIVECLFDKLQTKITECQQHNENTVETSGEPPATCGEKSTRVGDDDEEPLEEEDPNQNTEEAKKNMVPGFCKIDEEQKDQTDGGCDKAKTPGTVPKENGGDEGEKTEDSALAPSTPSSGNDEGNPEQTPVLKPEEEAPPKEVVPEKKVPEAVSPKEQDTQPPSPSLSDEPKNSISDILSSTIPFGIAIALTSIAFLFLKKKSKPPVDFFSVLEIPQNDYGIPTKRSPNRYIPYKSAQYRGKRYIYLEGDSGTDSGYTDHYSDITSSSESEYEELDINDIYVPHAPKYKTLIEVVLEPSKRDIQNDIQNDDIPNNKFTDEEWNTLKDDFISQYLPNIKPNDYTSGTIPLNIQRNTLYFDKPEEKPFIMSIHDRNLYTGEEYNYDMTTKSGNNDLYSGSGLIGNNHVSISGTKDPTSGNHNLLSDNHHPYSGIDLINDSLSGGNHDIYDEILKRKENELFGTENKKHTTTNNVAKPARDDPIHNQINLFHKWLDRHRNMCENWENHDERLSKLKEKWENDTSTSGNIHPSDIPSGKLSDTPSDNNIHSDIHPSDIPSGKLSDIPSGKLSDIPSGKLSDIPSGKLSDIPSSNKMLNTDVSIQIDIDNPKLTNEFTYVDSNPNLVGNINPNIVENINPLDSNTPNLTLLSNPNLVENNTYVNTPTNVQIEMDVNKKTIKEKYSIGDVWDI